MAEPIIPPRAKLFIGIMFSDESARASAEKLLQKKFGDPDYRTKNLACAHARHYRDMGPVQCRVLTSFKKLIRREEIVDIKIYANRIEKKINAAGAGKVNIDPGYLTMSNVYLASCREFFHRTYLRKGVYLENEYRYMARRYQPWEWTPPDYRKPEYLFFFHEMRRLYCDQIG